jgi:hypothetical protein
MNYEPNGTFMEDKIIKIVQEIKNFLTTCKLTHIASAVQEILNTNFHN